MYHKELMSVVEKSAKEASKPKAKIKRKSPPIINQILDFLSSVKFGVVLLCILVVLSFLGMIIIQQNVVGFDAYFAGLTPAEKTVYGALGLFDIYHSWYFNLILGVLSMNIILASIDRFPSAWSYISRPKINGTRRWLLAQDSNSIVEIDSGNKEVASKEISKVLKENGLKPQINEKNGDLYVFGESGKYNRLGAYIVHVALLTLFIGHLVANQTGFDADVSFFPGQTTDQIELIEFNLDEQNRFAVQLPFTIECLDIQQKLIDPAGEINVANTLDWRTRIKINDQQYGAQEADVSLNNPFHYRGYRFFQAQTIPQGHARTMTLELTPQTENAKPISVELMRNGSTKLEDGTLIEYETFSPDFVFNGEGKPDTKSNNYNNPVAILQVTPKDGEKTRVFAFAGNVGDDIPVGAPKLGYKWKLAEFEKAPLAHILSIKYDPFNGAFIAWYFGGIGLIFALVFVFFFSHRRIWALIERDEAGNRLQVVLGGHTNRNHFGFEDKFKRVIKGIKSQPDSDD